MAWRRWGLSLTCFSSASCDTARIIIRVVLQDAGKCKLETHTHPRS
ncbi:hypothetical protein SLEP1_g45965 [Rubroshorea leprosula]|uniref:Uncharacterized protein n=1 Tax=Rubroshorea leprosula TaxID=152421 RepID=A0AAV5IL22_9ROSI|nr:hypothetical protein SLEP1_g12178 [Rubroshorea leprosula]GKV38007.1 hypothetical protein SLEP1_g45965 [Rubroshorea leprosula]